MSVWQFFAADTGHPTGRAFSGDEADLADNTPAGCVAVAVDHVDDAWRLDLTTHQLVDWQPPAPASDPFTDWTWSAQQRRWVGTPSFAARQANRVAEVDDLMAKAEASQQRPLGDILAAITSGATPAPADVAKLAELRAYVAAGRAARAQLVAATDDTALAAVHWP